MIILATIVSLIIIFIVIVFIIKGRGKPLKLLDENNKPYKNSISTREKIIINGTKQYFFIVGENKNNPILLYLHGGPGTPELPLITKNKENRLEKEFTVCYWEQRGSGLSYTSKKMIKNSNVDEIVNDGIEISNYLRKRFNQDKIYLMGHSWGTFIGIKLLQKSPEYYKGYFGIGQISSQKLSEKQGYLKLVETAKKNKKTKDIRRLKRININSLNIIDIGYIESKYRKWMSDNKKGFNKVQVVGILESVISGLFFRGYSFIDSVKYILGAFYSTKYLLPKIYNENLMETSVSFNMPIYFFHGVYDSLVSYDLAKEYFCKIKSPKKAFISFEKSEHSPNLEETKRFNTEVIRLLKNTEQNNNKRE